MDPMHKSKRNKLKSKSKPNTIMVGYDASTKGYLLYCPNEPKVYLSCNVKLVGSKFSFVGNDVEPLNSQCFDSVSELDY
jgi:hypothetical protein